ncbi:MAG: acyl carrier protein [Arenicella sp.]|jgi:acyl carrier protein
MNRSNNLSTLKSLIAGKLDLNISEGEIDDDASLLEDGLALDSISMAEFFELVETQFEIKLLDVDLDFANFASLQSVCSLIERRQQPAMAEMVQA